MRSSPMPVSIEGRGSGTRLPPSCCSYCMNTRFQISMKRSPSASAEPGGPPGICVAVVVEDFRAGAARAGVAHRPEIVGAGDAQDLAVGEACDLLPQLEGVVVVDIDGDQQPILRQAEFLGDQRPGKLDRALLEIIAEREVAEHLEEGVVARGIADIVEVVVLAAGAHAFLRGHRAIVGALFQAGEDVLELHHAGIGEHQRRVVARHERRRRHDLVVVAGEEIDEAFADFVDAAHRVLAAAVLLGQRAKSPSGLMFRGLFSDGGAGSSRKAAFYPSPSEGGKTPSPPSSVAAALRSRVPTGAIRETRL